MLWKCGPLVGTVREDAQGPLEYFPVGGQREEMLGDRNLQVVEGGLATTVL